MATSASAAPAPTTCAERETEPARQRLATGRREDPEERQHDGEIARGDDRDVRRRSPARDHGGDLGRDRQHEELEQELVAACERDRADHREDGDQRDADRVTRAGEKLEQDRERRRSRMIGLEPRRPSRRSGGSGPPARGRARRASRGPGARSAAATGARGSGRPRATIRARTARAPRAAPAGGRAAPGSSSRPRWSRRAGCRSETSGETPGRRPTPRAS